MQPEVTVKITNTEIKCRVGSVFLHQQIDEGFKSITIENPRANNLTPFFLTDKHITITKVEGILLGSSSPSVVFNLSYGTNKNSPNTNVFVSNKTLTDSNTITDYATDFNDNTLDENQVLFLSIGAITGIVNQLAITVYYKFN